MVLIGARGQLSTQWGQLGLDALAIYVCLRRGSTRRFLHVPSRCGGALSLSLVLIPSLTGISSGPTTRWHADEPLQITSGSWFHQPLLFEIKLFPAMVCGHISCVVFLMQFIMRAKYISFKFSRRVTHWCCWRTPISVPRDHTCSMITNTTFVPLVSARWRPRLLSLFHWFAGSLVHNKSSGFSWKHLSNRLASVKLHILMSHATRTGNSDRTVVSGAGTCAAPSASRDDNFLLRTREKSFNCQAQESFQLGEI